MNILVSACLLGVACRYDGKSKPNEGVIKLMEKNFLYVVIAVESLLQHFLMSLNNKLKIYIILNILTVHINQDVFIGEKKFKLMLLYIFGLVTLKQPFY